MSSTPLSKSRSRRSQPCFSDLRLKPLSSTFSTAIADTTEHSQLSFWDSTPHSSYLTGRSAPPTPGHRRIDKRHHGGLSRKGSIYDGDDSENIQPIHLSREEEDSYFSYNAISKPSYQSPTAVGDRPKAKSEMALLAKGFDAKHTPTRVWSNAYTSDRKVTQSGRSTPRYRQQAQSNTESWLTHASAYTSSLLAESKGQSWMNLRAAASSNLLSHSHDSDSDSDTPSRPQSQHVHGPARMARGRSDINSSPHDDLFLRLEEHHTIPHMSPNPLASPWGSRFGSRAASARNSRRNSKISLAQLQVNTSHNHLSSGMPGATAGLSSAAGFSASVVGGMMLTQPSPDNQVRVFNGSDMSLSSPRDARPGSSEKRVDGNQDRRVVDYSSYTPDFINLSDKRDIAAARAMGVWGPEAANSMRRESTNIDGVEFKDADDEDEREVEKWMKDQNSLLGLGGALFDRILGVGGQTASAANKTIASTTMTTGPSRPGTEQAHQAAPGHTHRVLETKEEQGVWADARYLLGLASKVLL